VTIGLKPRWVVCLLAVPMAGIAGFVCGFSADKQLRRSPDAATRQQYLAPAGDASQLVQQQVLLSLQAFQEGYVRRNPAELDAFMSRPVCQG
jgi:hypothetical protein